MANLEDLKAEALAAVPSVTRHQSTGGMLAAAERLLPLALDDGAGDEAAFVYAYRLAQFLLKVSTHPGLTPAEAGTVRAHIAEAAARLEVLKPRILAARAAAAAAAAAPGPAQPRQ
jgi:hypothetical protein